MLVLIARALVWEESCSSPSMHMLLILLWPLAQRFPWTYSQEGIRLLVDRQHGNLVTIFFFNYFSGCNLLLGDKSFESKAVESSKHLSWLGSVVVFG
jgi:hypothetical protein